MKSRDRPLAKQVCELLRDFVLVPIADPIYTSGDVGTVLQSFEPLDATPSRCARIHLP